MARRQDTLNLQRYGQRRFKKTDENEDGRFSKATDVSHDEKVKKSHCTQQKYYPRQRINK